MTFNQASLSELFKWKVEVDKTWDVLGPFPIHAREQHFISPAFPLNLSQPIDYGKSWPSSFADGGIVKWSKTTSTSEGDIEVSFPQIRWKSLRATEGWAALQHHAILRTTLTFYPPSNSTLIDSPRILVYLKQGSYFTVRPRDAGCDFTARWFVGNIYDLERALPHVLDLPVSPSLTEPTEYDLYISGDYEIRLFGDPLVRNSEIPVQKLSLRVEVQDAHALLLHHQSQDIACDFLDGFAFGGIFGVGIQSLKGWWNVQDVFLKKSVTGIDVGSRAKSLTIAPLQTRVVPILIGQTSPFWGETLDIDIVLTSDNVSETLSFTIPITHHKSDFSGRQVLKGTFLFAGSMPSGFLAVPPLLRDADPRPPVLALHGAGVDIFSQDFWVKSLPENKQNWIIAPTGRTSWGLDWHGPSAVDAWASLEALIEITNRLTNGLDTWRIAPDMSVIIIGHSNGGQGTWYMASRYPDRVRAAVPTAAYIKSQAYIPLTLSRSGHFIDPSLRAILESSLTPDDNDLHLSNLVDTPMLAIHGGDDENVPVWHSREAVSILKSWRPSANITYKEDPGEGHWYPYVLNAPEVRIFLENNLISPTKTVNVSESFTLTVANPRECGSLHGWKITELILPGRLARLHVRQIDESTFELEVSNVHTFTVPIRETPLEISIDGQILRFLNVQDKTQIFKTQSGIWQTHDSFRIAMVNSAPGRIQSILTSPGPIVIVISENSITQNLSVAQRLAHVLYLYHRIDCEIIPEHVAIYRNEHASWAAGNIVFIGPPSSDFAKQVLAKNRTPVRVAESTVEIATQRFSKPGQAILFTHPHPTEVKPESFLVFILYNDESGLERAIRLFPFRTGVAGPDWLVVGGKMDNFGAGGIEAAGVWGRSWTLSQAMSWPSH